MTQTMLAAVAAAAGLTQAGSVVELPDVNTAFIKKHFPTIAAELHAEGETAGKALGMKAEQERIAGIEAALMPGHEKIIAEMKADGTKTPADAAAAVIRAENAARSGKLGQLAADETQLKGLRSEYAPANGDGKAGKAADLNPGLVGKKARDYIATQGKLGITVSAADAVAHITQEMTNGK